MDGMNLPIADRYADLAPAAGRAWARTRMPRPQTWSTTWQAATGCPAAPRTAEGTPGTFGPLYRG